MKTKVVVESTDGGEILVGSSNGLLKEGKLQISVHLKFVQGNKVISGWFDADELTKAIENTRSQEAHRLSGLVVQETQ